MQVVAVIFSLLLVFAIAAVVIGRETDRLIQQAPRPVFDVEEALAWVAERLAFDVTAVLSYAELQYVIESYIDEISSRRTTLSVDSPPVDDEERSEGMDLIISDDEAVSAVMARLEHADLEVSEEHVRAVLNLQVMYLQAIGAAGQFSTE